MNYHLLRCGASAAAACAAEHSSCCCCSAVWARAHDCLAAAAVLRCEALSAPAVIVGTNFTPIVITSKILTKHFRQSVLCFLRIGRPVKIS